MKKRILAMLLAGAMAISLVACGSDSNADTDTSSNPSETQGTNSANTEAEDTFTGTKEIVVGISADIKTWEPWGNFNLARQNEAPVVYQNLTTDVVDLENGEMVHCYVLAESTEQIDELTYQIKIREGIVDTAGNAFTAEDAIFSFEKCREVSSLSQVKIIDSMELVDELTFNMTLTNNTVGVFYDVCNAINMVTKESYEASPDGMVSQPVGTSPMVMTQYVAGSYVVFEKADSYWNDAANESKDPDDGYCTMWDYTNIDVIRFECITDTATMAIALENGDIDIARTIGTEDVALFESNDDFTVFSAPDAALGIAFNVSDNSATNNYNLRMAIALCINSADCLVYVADGNGEVAKSWSYRTFVDYQEKWDSEDYFEYDLDLAKQYLAKWEEETGQSASNLSLTIALQSEDDAEALALTIQSAIGQLTGNANTLTVESYDRATFTQAKKDATTFDLCIVDSQLVTRSHSGYEWDNLVNQTKNGYTIFHDSDDVLQEKLMAAIEVATTSDETVSAFQDYINEQCYMKNIIYVDAFGAAASWVGNVIHATGAKSAINLGALTYDWSASGK